MPRAARIVLPGFPHHVTQRGNNQQDTFFVDDDHVVYLTLLRDQAVRFGVRIEGYCLMTNHVHFVATPKREDSLSRTMGRTHLLYAQYINRMHGRGGHLWQNRFFSCPMDDAHFLSALRYMERNPVRARMHRLPWLHKWSSAAEHAGASPRPGLLDNTRFADLTLGLDWKAFLLNDESEAETAKIRLATSRGRPLASDSVLSKLEGRLNRRLRPLPVGRPKKVKQRKGDGNR